MRHSVAGRAMKYGDGQYTLHNANVDAYWHGVVLHLYFGEPCLMLGKDVVVYGKNPYYDWFDLLSRGHSLCLVAFGCRGQVNELTRRLIGVGGYNIAPWYTHPYIKGRRYGFRNRKKRSPKQIRKKADRRTMSIKMRKVTVTLDDSCI
jgi:hypothetical protein